MQLQLRVFGVHLSAEIVEVSWRTSNRYKIQKVWRSRTKLSYIWTDEQTFIYMNDLPLFFCFLPYCLPKVFQPQLELRKWEKNTLISPFLNWSITCYDWSPWLHRRCTLLIGGGQGSQEPVANSIDLLRITMKINRFANNWYLYYGGAYTENMIIDKIWRNMHNLTKWKELHSVVD